MGILRLVRDMGMYRIQGIYPRNRLVSPYSPASGRVDAVNTGDLLVPLSKESLCVLEILRA